MDGGFEVEARDHEHADRGRDRGRRSRHLGLLEVEVEEEEASESTERVAERQGPKTNGARAQHRIHHEDPTVENGRSETQKQDLA